MKIKTEHKTHLDSLLSFKSKEELIDMIADLQLQLRVEKAECTWLDRLADHLRDHANSSDSDGCDESQEEVDALYEELKEEKQRYQDKKIGK